MCVVIMASGLRPKSSEAKLTDPRIAPLGRATDVGANLGITPLDAVLVIWIITFACPTKSPQEVLSTVCIRYKKQFFLCTAAAVITVIYSEH